MMTIIMSAHASQRFKERMPHFHDYEVLMEKAFLNRNRRPTDAKLKKYVEYLEHEKCYQGETRYVSVYEGYIYIFSCSNKSSTVYLRTVYKIDPQTVLNRSIRLALHRGKY
jgi:hypothetical protein